MSNIAEKAKSTIVTHDGRVVTNTGHMAMAIQATRDGKDGLSVNVDWSFPVGTTPMDVKSMLGGFLGNIEEIFGEKMVTEMITHYGMDTGKLVKAPGGKVAYMKSRGIDFKGEKTK